MNLFAPPISAAGAVARPLRRCGFNSQGGFWIFLNPLLLLSFHTDGRLQKWYKKEVLKNDFIINKK